MHHLLAFIIFSLIGSISVVSHIIGKMSELVVLRFPLGQLYVSVLSVLVFTQLLVQDTIDQT